MAYSATDSVTNAGSGRSKLPARLREANFGATVVAALFPTKTTTQRNAMTGMTEPTFVYDTTLNAVVMYNGSAWVNLDGSALA